MRRISWFQEGLCCMEFIIIIIIIITITIIGVLRLLDSQPSEELHWLKVWLINFIFCWPCILLWFLVNDQLYAQFFSVCLFQLSTCFEQPRAHHQENKLHQYNIWYLSRSPTQSDLYHMLYWYNWFSWWWARGCSKHVESWNKHTEKNCASSWSFTKNFVW